MSAIPKIPGAAELRSSEAATVGAKRQLLTDMDVDVDVDKANL